jgi:hypothetical protein
MTAPTKPVPRTSWPDKYYQGLHIIETEIGLPCRHPKLGAGKAVLKGAGLLLLEDGSDVVVCFDCGYNGITRDQPYGMRDRSVTRTLLQQADTVQTHRSATHNRTVPWHPLYNDDQIKKVIRVYLKWLAVYKATRIRNWGALAAEELNQAGVKPFRATAWTSSTVGNLAREHLDKPQFKNLRPLAITDEQVEYLRRNAPAGADFLKVERIGRPYKHDPVNFDEIIERTNAVKAERLSGPGDTDQKEEVLVGAKREPVFSYFEESEPAERPLAVGIPQQGSRTAQGIVEEARASLARANCATWVAHRSR